MSWTCGIATSESTHDIRVIIFHVTLAVALLVKVEEKVVLAKEGGHVIIVVMGQLSQENPTNCSRVLWLSSQNTTSIIFFLYFFCSATGGQERILKLSIGKERIGEERPTGGQLTIAVR
ncbi:hypothetical protein K469DRAFT_752837 [Zopfia rhizophila CBS 207.26]|uniref:Uncharacterized protein n=1 Tax=Zopfia rhizophila CBS 207.26 TaxID=1314779 RepID=A0A6A6DSW4_9PEZI|nr:hypothetical protein K469DRAFT_752837 [Zopfia rhizophila CBS 207.26]